MEYHYTDASENSSNLALLTIFHLYIISEWLKMANK